MADTYTPDPNDPKYTFWEWLKQRFRGSEDQEQYTPSGIAALAPKWLPQYPYGGRDPTYGLDPMEEEIEPGAPIDYSKMSFSELLREEPYDKGSWLREFLKDPVSTYKDPTVLSGIGNVGSAALMLNPATAIPSAVLTAAKAANWFQEQRRQAEINRRLKTPDPTSMMPQMQAGYNPITWAQQRPATTAENLQKRFVDTGPPMGRSPRTSGPSQTTDLSAVAQPQTVQEAALQQRYADGELNSGELLVALSKLKSGTPSLTSVAPPPPKSPLPRATLRGSQPTVAEIMAAQVEMGGTPQAPTFPAATAYGTPVGTGGGRIARIEAFGSADPADEFGQVSGVTDEEHSRGSFTQPLEDFYGEPDIFTETADPYQYDAGPYSGWKGGGMVNPRPMMGGIGGRGKVLRRMFRRAI